MDLVVVSDPSGNLPKRRWGVRQRVRANIVALEGFDEGFRHTVRLRTADRVKQGTKFRAAGKSRVSLAVEGLPLSDRCWMGCGARVSAKRLH